MFDENKLAAIEMDPEKTTQKEAPLSTQIWYGISPLFCSKIFPNTK